jgi:hypothetical protein
MDQLALARSRGVSEAVISSLGLDQGPQALAQLKTINKGTVDQVTQLNAIVAQKTSDANTQMVLEKTQMLGALGQGLLAAQKTAADAISAALDTFNATLATAGMTQAQTYTAAIAAGMMSGIPAIMAAAAAVQAAMTGASGGSSGSTYDTSKDYVSPTAAQFAAMGSLTYRTSGGQVIQTADTPANRAGIPTWGGTILSGLAGGGWVGGIGGPTSDSNLTPTSRGEFVVNAAASAANASLLTAINSGQQVSSARSAPTVNVAAPQVHVYVDGQEFRGMVRVEIAGQDQAKAMTARRMVNA